MNSFSERYKEIANSDWFKRAYENKSLGVNLMEIEFVGFEESRDVKPEIANDGTIVNFWAGPINNYLTLKVKNEAGNEKEFKLTLPKEIADFICEKPEKTNP